MILPSILHFLNPFLAHDRSKTLNLQCSIWNGCLRSWAYVLMFLWHCRVPYSLMKRSGMNIDIYFDGWLIICGLGWFDSFLCVMESERMRLIGWELVAFLGADRLVNPLGGSIHGMCSLTWVHQRNDASALSRTPWGTLEFAISKNLSHTVPSDPSSCLNISSWMRSASTLVIGHKQNSLFNLIQSPPTLPCPPVVPNFCSPVRENRESFHHKVFWFILGMVGFQQVSVGIRLSSTGKTMDDPWQRDRAGPRVH